MQTLGEEDTLNILIATDLHVGYGERDAIIANDSLVTMEEIMKLAVDKEVDFILLGGDLFHDNKPSRKALHGAISLFRKYCFGSRPIQFEVISDQSVNFGHCVNPHVNYEDPNLNIQIPVFSIHGNHDDPIGQGNLCTLDLLHTMGLVNYFGKANSLENITVSPLLISKGQTKLALYGLGAIRDERLHRVFLNKNVSMLRPREGRDEWFNLFVLHQNRSKHSATNYIPAQYLDDFLDLVFWGHEHECRIDPEWNAERNFYITQPGSSVATSLGEGEAVKKHVGLLKIRGKDFKITKLPLQTVRQFYFDNVILCETGLVPGGPNTVRQVQAFCQERIEMLLKKANEEKQSRQPEKPLIRLRVDYSGGFDIISAVKFSQNFFDRVANPKDIILFHKKREMHQNKSEIPIDADSLKILHSSGGEDSIRVEEIVNKYFTTVEKQHQLQVLTEKGLSAAVREYVEKEENLAISDLVDYQVDKTQKHLTQNKVNEYNIEDELTQFKEARKLKQLHENKNGLSEIEEMRKDNKTKSTDPDFKMFENVGVAAASDEDEQSNKRGRGRGTRGGRGRGQTQNTQRSTRARGKRGKAPVVQSSDNAGGLDLWFKSPTRSSTRNRSELNSENSDFSPSLQSSCRSMRVSNKKRGLVCDSDDDDDEDMFTISTFSKRKR